jgi:hypothetical protein
MNISDATLYWIIAGCVLGLLAVGWLWRRERLRVW